MILPWQTQILRQLNELHLIRSSLLPGEQFAFVLPPDSEDLGVWTSLLDTFAEAGSFDDNGMITSLTHPPCQARFEVHIAGAPVWFEITLPRCTEPVPESMSGATGVGVNADTLTTTTISVRGARLSRDDQIRWQSEVRARINDIMKDEACAFPVYELLTLLAPALHQSQGSGRTSDYESTTDSSLTASPLEAQLLYHALLTSHHLVSPAKRRSLQQWSSQLCLSGFAKIGYPGVIYVEGAQDAVETFVRNVKGMQWLALRTRFVEPVPESESRSDGTVTQDGRPRASDDQLAWVELSKIGQVLEHMQKRGRGALVTNLGIGVPSKEIRH
ncbi:hypothetical protein JVU11DRAFT_6968 [Chiua virens]|nr:hypothetical protein JVU11DRAFT_6968 [Chiua virens]